MILAGDIGGTKTNVALFAAPGKQDRLATYRSADYSGLLPILKDFLQGEAIEAACFGIAGPIDRNRVMTPNLIWELDGETLARETGIPKVALINDLTATAEGIPERSPGEIEELNPAAETGPGNAALIAAGTGLGMAIIDRTGGAWNPLPSEGGHQNFAPRDDEQAQLLEFLRREHSHVSVERVVSGPGLARTYKYLRATGQIFDEETARRIAAGDPAAEIGAAGMSGTCGACANAIRIFLACFGNAAANLTLVAMATGGLFIGGGIAPRLRSAFEDGTFLRSFVDKGRLGRVLERVPIGLIRNPHTAVLGAARHAFRMAGDQP